MATVLLLAIYTVFIGLGLPDSVFGASWPAIFVDFDVPVGFASLVNVPIYLSTVIASIFSARLINKFGTGLLVALSTLCSGLAMLLFALSPSFYLLILCAIPQGAGAGAIDAAMNNYVATHYKPKYMNFLHCFYGVGVSLSPILMSFALNDNNNWRQGYLLVFYLMAVLTLIAFGVLPLWKKVQKKETEEEGRIVYRNLTLREMAKMPAVRISWLVFFSTCALEFTCGLWGATYLVGGVGLSESTASLIVTLYYVGITTGRLFSGFISTKFNPMKIVFSGYAIVAIALLVLFLPVPPIVKGVGLFLIGFGNGPSFPNLSYITPIYFGKDVSRSIIGTQLACCNLGILIVPPIFGIIANISILLFPPFLLFFFIIMIYSTARYRVFTKSAVETLKTK